MIQVRPFSGLGSFRNEWLNARHHFSFGDYHDPERMGFGRLRVWNDDEVAPGTGFDPHPHREMEIVTYIRAGRHHPSRQPRQRGPDRGGRRAGDACRHRHRACRVQPRGGADAAVPDLDPARSPRCRARLGDAAIPQEGGLVGAGERTRGGCRQCGAAAECRCRGARGHAARRRDGVFASSRRAAASIWLPRADR